MKVMRPIARLINRTGLAHLLPFGFYMVIYLLWFQIVERIPRTHYWLIALPIDRILPFVEQFIVPYLSWFLYMLVGVLLVYYMERREYDKLTTKLMFGMTVFLLISTFFPNRQPFRLLEMPRDNVFTHMVAGLWKIDTPTNVWPSIHVFNSVVTEAALLRAKGPFLRKKSIRIISIVWCVMICLSTVMIKQHSTLDIITAMALVLLAYLIVEVAERVITFPKWDEWSEKKFREWAK